MILPVLLENKEQRWNKRSCWINKPDLESISSIKCCILTSFTLFAGIKVLKLSEINTHYYLLTEFYRLPTNIENFNQLPTKEPNFNRQPTSGPPIQTLLWDHFGLKQVKSSKKVQQELFSRKKKGEKEAKSGLDYFWMLKLQEIFKTAAIVFHRYERLTVFKMSSPLFCFEQKKTLKNFSKKLYTCKIKPKKRSRQKSSAWDLKNA